MADTQTLAINEAAINGSLSLVERNSRFGDTFFAIADCAGTIEVADTLADAIARIRSLRDDALNIGNADRYNALDAIGKRWAA